MEKKKVREEREKSGRRVGDECFTRERRGAGAGGGWAGEAPFLRRRAGTRPKAASNQTPRGVTKLPPRYLAGDDSCTSVYICKLQPYTQAAETIQM